MPSMKTVKSADELRALALRTGAAVAIGNQRFNSTGVRAAPRPKPPPVPSPPEPVETQQPASAAVPDSASSASTAPDITPLVEALVGGQDRLAKALTELLQIERREHVTEPLRATPVAFDIERDGQGFINRIVPVYTTGAPN